MKSPRRAYEHIQSESGAAAVEFALVILVLITLIIGIIDMGRLVAAYAGASSAAREAARYGSAVGSGGGPVRYVDCAGIRNTAKQLSGVTQLSDDDIDVTYDSGPGTGMFGTCPSAGAGPNPASIGRGSRITVSITTEFKFLTPGVDILIPDITISPSSSRTIIKS